MGSDRVRVRTQAGERAGAGLCGATEGDARLFEHAGVPPLRVATESRTLARSMRSELPAPCTSRPPPLVVALPLALPLTTWIHRSVRLAPPVTSMARDNPSASMVAPSAPMPSSVKSMPRTTSGEPPRG